MYQYKELNKNEIKSLTGAENILEGFICVGHLPEINNFKDLDNEYYVWVFARLNNDNTYNIIQVIDNGNQYHDLYKVNTFDEDIEKACLSSFNKKQKI